MTDLMIWKSVYHSGSKFATFQHELFGIASFQKSDLSDPAENNVVSSFPHR